MSVILSFEITQPILSFVPMTKTVKKDDDGSNMGMSGSSNLGGNSVEFTGKEISVLVGCLQTKSVQALNVKFHEKSLFRLPKHAVVAAPNATAATATATTAAAAAATAAAATTATTATTAAATATTPTLANGLVSGLEVEDSHIDSEDETVSSTAPGEESKDETKNNNNDNDTKVKSK